MRDYQPHKNNPYWLEPTVHKRVLSVVRDYDRMVRDYNELLHETASGDGQPRSHAPGNPVAHKAEKMDRLWQDMRVIELAMLRIPEEYRTGVLRNVQSGGWPVDIPAHHKTWLYWRTRFLYFVASGLQII